MNFKINLIGYGGAGKTTWVNRYMTGDFKEEYTATLGTEINPIHIKTNNGPIRLNVWDCAGQDKYAGLKAGYYIGSEALIAMFDYTSILSFEETIKSIAEFNNIIDKEVPIILCGNKHDMNNKKVTPEMIEKFINYNDNVIYYKTSTKTNLNFEKPFQTICRLLTKQPNLRIVG